MTAENTERHLSASGNRLLRTNAEAAATLDRDRMPPNPWETPTTLRAAEVADAVTPDLDPNYEPHGTPPNGWEIARALRQVEQEGR